MEAKLVVVGGKANKAEVKLTLPAVIGRGRDADLTVAHATVSRRHCMLYEQDGALIVRDNSSLNGTVIEGERIKEAVLKPGETLTVGPLTFRADYEHFGEYPSIGEQPTLPNVHDTVGEKQSGVATKQVAPQANASKTNTASAADSQIEMSLHEVEPPAEEQAPSLGFLSEPEAPTAAQPKSTTPPAAPKATSPADSDVLPLDLVDDDAPAAKNDDSPSFGFLKGIEEKPGAKESDSQPEITMHDPEEAAATTDSGEYSLAIEPEAEPTPEIASKPPTKPAATAKAAPSSTAKKPKPDAAKPAAKADSAPEINVGAKQGKTAAPEDAELNNFFESIGLE